MTQRHADAVGSATPTADTEPMRTRSEQLHLRNYDENRQYRLTVSVLRPDGQLEYETTHELAPGVVATESEIVPPGRYQVSVSGSFRPVEGGDRNGTAGRDGESRSCNVGYRPPQTIVVECGNGIVTVSEGLFE